MRNLLDLSAALLFWFGLDAHSLSGQTNQSFDGRPWNVSSGNLSVTYIQASPVGAFPRPDVLEPPPPVESQERLKTLGLVANEDYVAWGAVEHEPGQWVWKQHDAMEHTLHKAGLKYVVYDWVHFPPVWLRDQQKEKRTLMRCLEHGQEANYLSIFDPRTIEWYDHFYKNLRDHFGDRIDDVYACILGPYGEGNYPLKVPDWINMGHCHEGYWCGDAFAVQAFQISMKRRYAEVARLNLAWGTDYHSFDEIRPLRELSDEKFKPKPEAFPASADKRRWLDFITWYHQAIIDFTEQSVRTVLKYFPREKVRTKPGGNARGVNPISWGTYCPGYAKMAQPYRIVLQPADCQGAVFGDKWLGTAYQFYGVKECSEPAGDLDDNGFVRRVFSDASCGASQLFSYQFERHSANIRKYVRLFTGKSGDTDIAVYRPTTFYRLGGDLQPTIEAAYPLRDLCEFDVLDELLIADGALTMNRYKAMILFQADIVDKPILEKFDAFLRAGGRIIQVGDHAIQDVEGKPWPVVEVGQASRLPSRRPALEPTNAGETPGRADGTPAPLLTHVAPLAKSREWLKGLAPILAGLKGVDGQLDGLWTCRRGTQVMIFNSTDKATEAKVGDQTVQVAAHTIWFNEADTAK